MGCDAAQCMQTGSSNIKCKLNSSLLISLHLIIMEKRDLRLRNYGSILKPYTLLNNDQQMGWAYV